jgi:hypothetical protein
VRQAGSAGEAEPLLRQALEIRRAKLDSTDVRISETRMAVGLAASPWAARQLAECRARMRS